MKPRKNSSGCSNGGEAAQLNGEPTRDLRELALAVSSILESRYVNSRTARRCSLPNAVTVTPVCRSLPGR